MKTKFLIWKNPFYSGNIPEWQEINGAEFYALVSSLRTQDRYFVKLPKASKDDVDVVMETTKTEYVKWRKDKDHSDYLIECQINSGFQTVTIYDIEVNDTGDCYGEEFLADSTSNVEDNFFEMLESVSLKEALSSLTSDEFRMIEYLFMLKEKHTEQDYSTLTGIPRRTISYRKTATLAKLKKYFEN